MAGSSDRFSLLPDSLLVVIVSLLSFKDAVRTSVLSKRWLNTVRSMTNVELNELFFVNPNEPDETREAQRRAFLEFATSWIDNYRESVVKKFSLKLSMPENAGEVIRRCIAFATDRGVKELELDFSDSNWEEDNYLDDYLASFELPGHVYRQSGDLEYLKLYSCSLSEANLHSFYALKEVSLGWMEVTTYAMKTLLSNCEMLESLSLKRCWAADAFDLGDDGMRLRKLVLDKCHFHYDFFRVNSPHLRVFKYSGAMNYFYVEASLPLIEQVELDFSHECGFEGHGEILYDLVEDLYAVRVLTVCSYLLQVIPTKEKPLRIQCNLNVRHLVLKTALHEDEYFGIAFMLNSCPMLERLTIEIGLPRFLLSYVRPINVDHPTFWGNYVRAYRCLRSSLKEVEIKGFKGSLSEMVVLNHLVAHGRVLRKMTVNVVRANEDGEARNWEDYRRGVAEVLLTVQKASTNLEILII